MDPKNTPNPALRPSEWNRRDFLGMLGASAAAGVVGANSASGQSSFPVYQDSFGNTAPAAGDALNVGVYPPPPYAGSGVAPNYTQPNILMIMVDQLRSPRWLPAGGQAAIDQKLPNIAFLRDHSFNFPNYFVAATDCTPCRATLLTGLYSQQNFIFRTQTSGTDVALQPGFPTFANALSQQANYATCWIGKWHLSDAVANGTDIGANGPGDYGFTGGILNLPKNSSIDSPNGFANEGTCGSNDPPYGSGTLLNPQPPLTNLKTPPYLNLSDGAIANWFINNWLPAEASNPQPWFTAVSFVNPHDITAYPNSFGQGSLNASVIGYQPPPTSGFAYNSAQPDNFVPPLDLTLYPSGISSTTIANINDDCVRQPYGPINNVYGKPGLQGCFEVFTNNNSGTVSSPSGWYTFLNYYFWMQACVDYQIGRVLNSLAASKFASNTIIIFTADHGDYGGSHGLHTKGGALYDEAINVPLLISFPEMRPPFAPASTARIRPYVCSSVDIFPFLYTLALGHHNWRTNAADPYMYLSGRECILDAIFSTAPAQRRLSPFPNANGPGFQPYVLHTTDEFQSAYLVGNQTTSQPSHAIGYRTVDTTVTLNSGAARFTEGGSLACTPIGPATQRFRIRPRKCNTSCITTQTATSQKSGTKRLQAEAWRHWHRNTLRPTTLQRRTNSTFNFSRFKRWPKPRDRHITPISTLSSAAGRRHRPLQIRCFNWFSTGNESRKK